MGDRRKRILEHLSSAWGPLLDIQPPPAGGRGEHLGVDFSILKFQKTKDVQAYSTCCLSIDGDAEGLELFMLLGTVKAPEVNFAMLENLASVAVFERGGARLKVGDTVNLGRPWVPGATCSHLLVSIPYLEGPKLGLMKSPPVRFLWLLPVTEQEISFKKEHGLEALELKFEQQRLDYAAPKRKSVV